MLRGGEGGEKEEEDRRIMVISVLEMISRLGSIGSAGGGTVQLSSGEYFMNSYQFMNQLPNAPFSKSRISYFRA